MKKKLAVWRKATSWRVDLVFLLLVVVLGGSYLLQPQRGAALQDIWQRVAGLAEKLSQPVRVWVAPPSPSWFQGEGLARFGSDLEFLGCDTAITQDQQGTRIWHLTLWRALRPISADDVLVMEVVPGDGSAPIRVEHRLGQQFQAPEIPTSRWQPGQVVIDATLLPVELEPGVDYHQRIRLRRTGESAWLPAYTPFLEQDSQGWLTVCE